jgi:hypothetical protein
MKVARLGVLASAAVLVVLARAGSVSAQSAEIRGRVVDEQQRAVPGATITLTSPRTGLTRTDLSDGDGLYRFAGLPPGMFDIRASLAGFTIVDRSGTTLQVGAVVHLDFVLRVAPIAESVSIVHPGPMIDSSSATVSGVVEPRRIEELPLNGRQFANLAATLPGVGIAFHRDPTKGTQYTPQVGGGAGRNVNYQVDGGDNNDDTVGGQLQMFPLDSIEEFRFSVATVGAESGRSSGGIMNVVTKSGTNRLSGSTFVFFRDDGLNSQTTTEQRLDVPKSDYRRWQYGGSAGGPIRRDRAHFFGAVERVQQDTFQAVDTKGLFPDLDGVFPVEYRETLATVKATLNLREGDYSWVRYGLNTTSQPAGVGALRPPQSWGDSDNRFHSINARYARLLSATAVNELTFQYATFLNHISANTDAARETFPNGVIVGQGPNLPQATEQRKFHVRDDVSVMIGGGLGHMGRAGFAVSHDPFLGSPPSVAVPGFFAYEHLDNDPRGPITRVNGNTQPEAIEFPAFDIPMSQLGVYVQDDWRVTDRLTLNAGLRYDLAIGYNIDQSANPNFVALQEAGRSGRLAGMIGLEDFGKDPETDCDNLQPRLGFALDVRGNGTDVLRGGWGIYADTSYTNSNILFAASDAQGPGTNEPLFSASDPSGLRNPDGSFFRVGDPVSNLAALNEGGTTGLIGEVISPRLRQPFTRQASFGWSHLLNRQTSFSVDVIHADGRDLNVRARLNSRPDGGPRRFSGLGLDPNSGAFRTVISPLRSVYDALLLSLRRRSATGLDFALNYTLSGARSELGQGVDETGLGPNTIQDAEDPFATVGYGPAASDARHLVSLSAIVPLGWQTQLAPIFYYRSALPVFIVEGLDRNNDGNNNDVSDRAFAFDGAGRAAREIGACATVNCGRGAASSQFNMRLSRQFVLYGSRLTLIGEVFNLFNASNPSGFRTPRLIVEKGVPLPNPDFLQPAAFSGDFQQPVQRAGQLAVRWTF